MMNQRQKLGTSSGFTLIEVLVAMVIFSFGVLAIANFQAALVSESGNSKARSEAIQYAQEKLDEIRNFSTEQQLVANLMNATLSTTAAFPGSVTNGTYPTTAESITGTNADFARQWVVTCGTGSCVVVANVSWTDSRGDSQVVSLNTQIAFQDPRGSADLDTNTFEPLVPSATGRAYLGDGTVDLTDVADADKTDNLDGTISVANVGDDRVLVDSSNQNDDGTYNIVLTLEDACVTQDGTCIDFVKISGRVYEDLVGNPTAGIANYYVLASDAAYCARGTVNTTTPNGNYKYYDYTCYLGGGWHGNVGMIIVDAGNQDYACLGDPSSPNTEDDNAMNNWRQMELASRRVYRGMTFIGDATSPAVLPDSTLYYSQGIGDAVVLPDPAFSDPNSPHDVDRTYGHDYVITRITGTATGSKCLSALTRADSNVNGTLGDRFLGSPTDFVCLNEDPDPDPSPDTFKYLDTLRTGHWAKDYCPYDPSRGPALVRYITGTVTVSGGAYLSDSMIMNSVNPDTCSWVWSTADLNNLVTRDVTWATSSAYACAVYDWGNGWTGSIYVDEAFKVDCPAPQSFTAITTNQTYDIACNTLPLVTTYLYAPPNSLAGASIVATRDDGTVMPDCKFTEYRDFYYRYDCPVVDVDGGNGWDGTVDVTLPAGITCSLASSQTYTDVTSNVTKWYGCSGPSGDYYYQGSMQVEAGSVGSVDLSGTTAADITPSSLGTYGTASVSCTIDSATASQVDYSCTVTATSLTSMTLSYASPVDSSCSSVYTSPYGDGASTDPVNPILLDPSVCRQDLSGPITVTGNVTTDSGPNDDLIAITVTATDGTSTVGGTCLPSAVAAGNTAVPYSCTTNVLADTSAWNITISYEAGNNVDMCSTSPSGSALGTGVFPISITNQSPAGSAGKTLPGSWDIRVDDNNTLCP